MSANRRIAAAEATPPERPALRVRQPTGLRNLLKKRAAELGLWRGRGCRLILILLILLILRIVLFFLLLFARIDETADDIGGAQQLPQLRQITLQQGR